MCPGIQESVDQFWQLVAVAAFEDRSGRKRRLAQPLTEEGKILEFETHLSNWIARIAVETGRDEQEVRRKLLQDI